MKYKVIILQSKFGFKSIYITSENGNYSRTLLTRPPAGLQSNVLPQQGGCVIETLHFNKKIWDRTEVVVITRWSLYRGGRQLGFYCNNSIK